MTVSREAQTVLSSVHKAILVDNTQQLRSTLRQSNLMIPAARFRRRKVLGPCQSLRGILDILGRVDASALLCASIHLAVIQVAAV
jgi:hypothetical protein